MVDSATGKSAFRRADLTLSTDYVAPHCEAGEALVEIWREVLDIDKVGLNDDFFEIGGDSLGAAIIAGSVESRFDCRFSPSQLIELSTIAAQLAHISKQRGLAGDMPSNMTVFHGEGGLDPLFILHGSRGFTLYDRSFLDGMDKRRPVIFIEAVGLDGRQEVPPSVEGIAELYLEQIRQVRGDRPWHLAANCGGSLIALEMCRQLRQQGRAMPPLILMDPVSHLFQNLEPTGLRRWKRIAGRILFPVAARQRFREWRGQLGLGGRDAFEQTLERDAGMQALLEKRIHQRAAGSEVPLLDSNVPYQAEAMHRVLKSLHRAHREHVPVVWDGDVYIVVSRPRAGGISFIRTVLPKARFRVLPYVHKQLFREGIGDLLQFLDDALHQRDEPGMFE